MKLLIISILLLSLTGCASYANYRNSVDPCQRIGKEENYKFPNYCFANAGKQIYYVRDVNNKVIYTIK